MKPTRIAGRFARALFDVAVKEADPQRVERELSDLVELLRANPVLQKALANRIIPADRKRRTLRTIGERAGWAPVLAKALDLLVERDAIAILPDVLERYRQRLMEHLGTVRAEVTSAIPLPADRVDAIRAALAAATGKQVLLEARVDPGLIGGVVAKVGSTVYDGSITRQLERIRDTLVQGAGV
jgi:F-type H+-transporting ATPase subunit delta